MAMEVKLEWRNELEMVFIRIKLGDLPEQGKTVWMRPGGGADLIPYGGEIPVFMKMPTQVFEAIGKSAFGALNPDSDDVRDALHDSHRVRDRLLTLVESVVNHP